MIYRFNMPPPPEGSGRINRCPDEARGGKININLASLGVIFMSEPINPLLFDVKGNTLDLH